MRIFTIIGIALAGAALVAAGAGGAIWYVAQQPAPVPQPLKTAAAVSPPKPVPERQAPRRGAAVIELETLRQLLSLVDAPKREAVLKSPEIFSRFVEQERASQAVLTAAYENGADRNEAVAAVMLRASQKILAEAYLAQVVRRNLDPDFPSEAETRAFYDANPTAFKLPQRLHLWQIFIPAGEASTEQARNNAKALATQLAKGITAGRMTFEAAAAKHSKHVQSRVNDGYMGLLNTDDLLPEVRTAVDKLKPDAVSAPIESNAGFHVIKRGTAVAGKQLAYAAVQDRIVVQLRREAANRVREAALKKILETYPVSVDSAALDAWLQALRSNTWPTVL